MLYLLVQRLESVIASHGWLGPLRLFDYVEFRAVIAMLLSCALVLLAGPKTIRWLLKQKIGDHPEFDHADLNQLMRQKANTPTMGGVLIVGAIVVVTLLLADLHSYYVVMALVCVIGMFFIGAADDWLKLTTARRLPGSRHGLYSWEKLLFQIGLATVLGVFAYHHGASKFTMELPETVMSLSINLPFLKSWVFENGQWVPAPHVVALELPRWLFVLIAVLFIAGTSNAVNLTDGMDGLAGGVMGIVAFAFMILCFIAGYTAGNYVMAKQLLVPYIPFADELAVVAGAMVGACVGFLWFNCNPAQVFMGDSGSLALGGLIGFIAVVIRQEILLLLIGGIFFLELASVVLQVGYFKISGGKRIFRCAPIHHHFHLGGWTEQQVVVRFWLISVMLVALALATIRLR